MRIPIYLTGNIIVELIIKMNRTLDMELSKDYNG